MKRERAQYVPAADFHILTPLYHPIVRITTRELTLKQRLLDDGEISHAGRVLDIGCGTGTLLLLARRQGTSAELIGLDGDNRVLTIAASKARLNSRTLRLARGVSFELPFPDESFDRVFSSLMLHHLTRNEKLTTLGEAFRVLKAGGSLHVADWGTAHTLLMRVLSLPLRLPILDRMNRTRDNVQGRIPDFLRQAGFEGVTETTRYSTTFGTLSIYRGLRPESCVLERHAAQQVAAADAKGVVPIDHGTIWRRTRLP